MIIIGRIIVLMMASPLFFALFMGLPTNIVTETATHEIIVDAGLNQTVFINDTVQFNGSAECWDSNSYPVWPVDLSLNGELLAAGWDKNVSLFSTTSNKPKWTYNTTGRVGDLKLSNDGTYLSVGSNTKIYFFNTSSSTPLWSVDVGVRLDADPGNRMDMTRDGRFIAATAGKYVKIFDSTSATPTTPYWTQYIGYDVAMVKFSGDGKNLVIGTTTGWL
jgi:hypothetical protein